MPRIRSIKYEFFINEDVASVGYPARLLFIGLWTLADRDGRLEERLLRIKSQLFSYDADADIETWLEDLDECGVLSRYTVGNKDYIQIKNFAKHQKPHPKEPESTLPAVEKNGKTRKRRKVQPAKNEKSEPSRRSFNGLMVSGSMASGFPEQLASQVPAAKADVEDSAHDYHVELDDEKPRRGLRAKKKTRDPRIDHPAIRMSKGIMGRYPDKILWDEIIEATGGTPEPKRLNDCRKEWVARGYNPNSMDWLLSWYRDGAIPERNVNGSGKTGRPNAGNNGGSGKSDFEFTPKSRI